MSGRPEVELQGDISRLEPHLEDVSRVAHPLRRIGERARRRRRRSTISASSLTTSSAG